MRFVGSLIRKPYQRMAEYKKSGGEWLVYRNRQGKPVGTTYIDPKLDADEAKEKVASEGDLMVRKFIIDKGMQGKGYGKASGWAMMKTVSKHFPDAHNLVATVNQENPQSQSTFRKLGFKEQGIYHSGGAGPQTVYKISMQDVKRQVAATEIQKGARAYLRRRQVASSGAKESQVLA